ncbi:MAG: DUF4249 family protein [Gemmatimonadetes bacterium]|nr:DUF4249 family protein [Gemmatimonadota bacterium]
MVRGIRPAAVILFLAGCKLTETVTTPYGDPFLVVHSVLQANQTRQSVIVERSSNGFQTRVANARVRLEALDPGDCTSPVAELSGDPYVANVCRLQPGMRVALRVETTAGEVVTGVTRVPGVTAMEVSGGTPLSPVPFGTAGSVLLDRTRDSIRVAVTAISARGLQVEVIRPSAGGFVTYRTITDSMGLAVPGDLVDPFDGNGRTVFRVGAYYVLSAAVTDTNYFDFVRSGTNPLTGRGFINHLTGGVGVFGSVLVQKYQLKVVAPQTDPREGVYRITGNVLGPTGTVMGPTDITWNVFRDPVSTGGFAGFVYGTWAGRPLDTSANLTISDSDGSFAGILLGSADSPAVPEPLIDAYILSGKRDSSRAPFTLDVSLAGNIHLGTLTAVQVSGPP